jgi:GTP-binding protein
VIDFQKTTFVKTVVDINDRPGFLLPEVIFIGRSNVGKSSLINALTKQKKLAKTSSQPGKTRYLNYFNVDDQFYLVDAPGFGYTKRGTRELGSFAQLMETYFQMSEPRIALYLIDARRVVTEEDVRFIHTLNKRMHVILIFTKTDKLNQKETAMIKKHILQMGLSDDQYVLSSLDNTRSITRIQKLIEQGLQ